MSFLFIRNVLKLMINLHIISMRGAETLHQLKTYSHILLTVRYNTNMYRMTLGSTKVARRY